MTTTLTRRGLTAASLILSALCTAHAQTGPVVRVAEGDLLGLSQDGLNQFRGIRYASPPVGPLRWVAPQAPQAWSGVRDATQFGASCPQAPEPFADNLSNSEDCLSLNVYAPAAPVTPGGKPRPVIVWIPGGGAVLGSARQYDASYLANKTQAVVVTMNYRLGALGYLWTSGMVGEKKGHNFSIQDQQAALRWVQRNIAAFHGDPKNVTLSGESVGSISASLHLVSPTAAGLFHRVLMASGIVPPAIDPSAKAAAKGDAFAQTIGCPPGPGQMACLRATPVDAILRASPTYADIGRAGDLYWKSFIDGEVVTDNIFSAISKGQFNRVPIIVGSTRDEGRGFIPLGYDLDGTAMTEAEYVAAVKAFIGPVVQPVITQWLYPSARLGNPSLAFSQFLTDSGFACQANEVAQRASTYVPVYTYEFADRTAPEYVPSPFMASGAFHAADLLYWFQTPVGAAPLTLNAAQLRLSDQMIRYWKRFAETGDPNVRDGSADPAWPRYNKLSTPYLTLVPDAITVQDWGAFQRAHQCGTWSTLYVLRALGLS